MQIPVINISSMLRIGPKGYFITENYVISIDKETGVNINNNPNIVIPLWWKVVGRQPNVAMFCLSGILPLPPYRSFEF